jgi:hypothetical protein
MNTRIESKNSILNDTLVKIFGDNLNLARIKFIGLFISALIKVQTVSFEKLAVAFDSEVNTSSSLRRIQRFIANYMLDTNIISRLVFALLPNDPPFRLSIDRTNWKFGKTKINILAIAIVHDGVAFPLLYSMLPKFGNSSTKERIELMDRYINLFGKETIECVLADREFIGEQWIRYLNINNIRYHIRIRNNFWVTISKNGHIVKASWLFSNLKINQFKFHEKIVILHGQYCYLSASKVKNKQGVPELQIIISFNNPQKANVLYKDRWQIETLFKALKTSGFNMEDTHLSDIERINKLFALVMIAFVWSYKVGIYLHSIVPIKIKKHGRRAYSFFKYGLNTLAKVLYNFNIVEFERYCKFLSCT